MKENILNSRPFETDLHLVLSLSDIRFFNALLAIRKEKKKIFVTSNNHANNLLSKFSMGGTIALNS